MSNNSLEQSVALWTAMNEILQDGDVAATSLRFITQRMRNTAGQLRDMGEDADGAAESITALQQRLIELTGVNIMSDANTFKPTYEALKEIYAIWDTTGDKKQDVMQAEVTRLLAGTRQAAAFSALMLNFASAENSLQTALEASGSAMREHERWLDSIEAKTQQFKASFEVLSNQLLNSDLIKGAYDTGTGILSFLSKAIELLGAIPVLATTAAMALSYKNIGISKVKYALPYRFGMVA